MSSSTHADRIRATGARATPARLAVLRLLESADRALSHHDVETALDGTGIDRVTLYRVLDWMVEAGLAHRVTDAQRVFRFSIANAASPTHSAHAHFRCDACGKVFCLDDIPATPPALPRGFASRAVELCVTGHCDRCKQEDSAPAAQTNKD
ncbi:Fur family transcriptional regulator [Viridibacterium curvum]|uniref:Transcriptional repressor n=1 Tax=Viridibacterium curvum TaxID=1101404 RepID=A0ABP9QM70_9RHOO